MFSKIKRPPTSEIALKKKRARGIVAHFPAAQPLSCFTRLFFSL
jgi:hypothetical protein